MTIPAWMRYVEASGTLATKRFQGPGKVSTLMSLATVQGIRDPRFVVSCQGEDGERVSLPHVIDRGGEVLSGFSFTIRREALGPSTLEVTVERTGHGEEPEHVFAWVILRGPDAPKEKRRRRKKKETDSN